jgi:hypothetical protein
MKFCEVHSPCSRGFVNWINSVQEVLWAEFTVQEVLRSGFTLLRRFCEVHSPWSRGFLTGLTVFNRFYELNSLCSGGFTNWIHRIQKVSWTEFAMFMMFCEVHSPCSRGFVNWINSVQEVLWTEFIVFRRFHELSSPSSGDFMNWIHRAQEVLRTGFTVFRRFHELNSPCSGGLVNWIQQVQEVLWSRFSLFSKRTAIMVCFLDVYFDTNLPSMPMFHKSSLPFSIFDYLTVLFFVVLTFPLPITCLAYVISSIVSSYWYFVVNIMKPREVCTPPPLPV